MGDGSVSVAGTLVEDHQECNERHGGVGVGQYVRHLVATDREERGHSVGGVCEDVWSEHEPDEQ